MHFTSEQLIDGSLVERHFMLGDIPGILWTPTHIEDPGPLVLQGHPGGLDDLYPRLLTRVRQSATSGHCSATIELPGSGERPAIAEAEQARADLRESIMAGRPVDPDLIDRLILPLVDQAVPEWQSALDALLDLPELGGPVGYSGGFISIGVRLALVEPRLAAAVLFAGSFIPDATKADARRVTLPLHVLLQWDDEHNDRQAALDLFDAFGSPEKSMNINMGGHLGVPPFAGEVAERFLSRHLAGDR